MENQLFLEIIGYAASVLIAISLMMRSLIRFRIINGIGALVFVIYGLLIKAYPIAFLNGIIVLIDLYYLLQMLRRQAFFMLMEVAYNSRYLQFFLNFHKNDIRRFFPSYNYDPQENDMVFFILRNTMPAGLVIIRPNKNQGKILLDYALKDFRDFTLGAFIFDDHADLLIQRGIKTLEARGEVPSHTHYLRQMGFSEDDNGVFHRILHPHLIHDQEI